MSEDFDFVVASTAGDTPLISCLMVTRGRLVPARFAVDCYRSQSWPERELLIVCDEPATELRAFVAALADPTIRFCDPADNHLTLGQLRNWAVEHARGEFVCQWDDDDLYHPERLAVQFSALRQSSCEACVLERWTLWWPARQRLGVSGRRHWEGTILARRSIMPAYPAARRGEDTEMLDCLKRTASLVSIDAPELYVYVSHGLNTFGDRHFAGIFSLSVRRWLGDAYSAELARMSSRLPMRDYARTLAFPAPAPRCADGPIPLVSVVIRSMGRRELAEALRSVAAQDHPRIEVIVIDASGGLHPPLPEVVWRAGHTVRLVSSGRRMDRAAAANAGLEQVAGEWFAFLDDDDTFEPDHVSSLLAAARDTPCLVVYGRTRLINAIGEVEGVSGMQFDRSLLAHGPLHTFGAALIRRRVLELGCRFDEALEVSEDRDFFQQIAQYSDFLFVDEVTFNYHTEAGTSGTGRGPNTDTPRRLLFEQRLQAKWFGVNRFHAYRAQRDCERAVRLFGRGQADTATGLFRRTLAAYPSYPAALYGLGYIALVSGDAAGAEPLLQQAADINPAVGEYRLTLANAHRALGNPVRARMEAQAACTDGRSRDAALRFLKELGDVPAPAAGAQRAADQRRTASRRERPASDTSVSVGAGLGETLANIESMLVRGESDNALGLIRDVPLQQIRQASVATRIGEVCCEAGLHELALSFLSHAITLPDAQVSRISAAIHLSAWAQTATARDAAIARFVRDRLARGRAADGTRAAAMRHIIGDFRNLGGAEQQALGLFRCLSRLAPVRLWSVSVPRPEYAEAYPIEYIDSQGGCHPEDGHLIFVGQQFAYGSWLEHCRPRRITINVVSPALQDLIDRIADISDCPSSPGVDFTFPSAFFRGRTGLPGEVEYPSIDLERFMPTTRRGVEARLVIGRHSRDVASKFHPNDPSLFRRLAAQGHSLRLLGGTVLRRPLNDLVRSKAATLLPESMHGVPEFLDGLDCFIYRTHPDLVETFGIAIVEAMAMELPVVIIGSNIGCAELVEHGENGFCVESEAEAIECIELLSADVALRKSIGKRARATISRLQAEYGPRCEAFYLG